MKECDICKVAGAKDSFHFIYEDDKCFAMLHESPAVPGHAMVIPRKHATIIEELDDEITGHLFVVANKISSALFETLGAHGTNIILNNGVVAGQEVPHVVVHVLPRKEDDGLNLEWEGRTTSEPELSTTQSMIKNTTIIKPTKKIDKPKPKEKETEEENYLIKGLIRTP